jgi:hypothetical protein
VAGMGEIWVDNFFWNANFWLGKNTWFYLWSTSYVHSGVVLPEWPEVVGGGEVLRRDWMLVGSQVWEPWSRLQTQGWALAWVQRPSGGRAHESTGECRWRGPWEHMRDGRFGG